MVKMDVLMRYANPFILLDVLFGRASLRWALKQGSIYHACEIGVQAGINAATILRRALPYLMICVDPYDRFQPELGMDGSQIEKIAHRRLKRFKTVKWVRSRDRDEIARALLEAGRMDYLYIDAAHDYESVCADMRAYWPCVARGGVMAGHDIVWPSVFRAVADFQREYGVEVQCSGTDWWIQKEVKTNG